ncbi:hypothetical protein Tco_1045324 [Tanacetum coccineum]|uniref:Uncharacterized protein n=1 Tax=Tanacetum coccineum TaxID=301880 RepID=A0ABQ5GTH2_9ASTR
MDTEIPHSSGPTKHVADEAVHKERGDSLVRDATTASSLELEQDSGSGLGCQETMGDTIAQTRRQRPTSSGRIVSLKMRVKKLEQKKRSRTHMLKRLRNVGATARVESSGGEESFSEDASKQGRINSIDTDDDITLYLAGDKVSTVLLQQLSIKPKAKGIAFREPGESTTTITLIPSKIQDKGKAKIIKHEPVKKLSKKDQLKLDEEIALKLQAEIDEEGRIARAEEENIDEVNIA